MKTIYIRGGEKESSGVLALKHHLEALGHKVVRSKEEKYDVIFCWGCSTRDLMPNQLKPAINAQVNLFNKLEAMHRFELSEVPIPSILTRPQAELLLDMNKLPKHPFPWFSRKVEHYKGKDIVVIGNAKELAADLNARRGDFYSVFLPNDQELRVWVLNGEVFAVYEKEYKNHGIDNYKNLETRSEFNDELRRVPAITAPAIAAVKALKMEFGAVDMIRSAGKYYVLEVNSQPDISSNIRVSGMRLAKQFSQWAERQ